MMKPKNPIEALGLRATFMLAGIKETGVIVALHKDHADVVMEESQNIYCCKWADITPYQDMINHPAHYNTGKIEVIDFIEDQKLGYCLGNAVKYICRARHKGKFDEDIKKAIWFLEREIRPGSSTSNRKP